MLEVKEVQTLSEQEKTISLFEFIKELNKLKQKVVLNIKDYPWRLAISDIPVFSEYIKVSYRDRVEEESETTDDLLLSIRKFEFEECPIPDELFADWLISGWDDYHTEAEVFWNDWAGVSFGFVAASIIALQRKRWNVLFPNLQLLVLSRKLLKTATAVNNEPLNC